MHVALPLKFADFAGREGPAGPIEFRPWARKPILRLLSPHTYIYIYIHVYSSEWCQEVANDQAVGSQDSHCDHLEAPL